MTNLKCLAQWLALGWQPLQFGGSPPAAPPPDPAIGQAAAQNSEIARESLAFNRQVYEEGKPRQAELDLLSKQVVAAQISSMEKSGAASDDYLNYMKTTFRPLEQGLAEEARTFNTEGKAQELAERAGADVETAAAAADQAAMRQAARYGVRPSDGAFQERLAQGALDKTAIKVGAMNNARTMARAEGRALTFDVTGLGRGLPGAGATSAQLGIQAGGAALGAGTAAGANARAGAAQMNQGFGAAVGANQSAANMLQGVYGTQANIYGQQSSAAAAENASAMGAVGSLAGLGAAAFFF